MRTRGTHGAVVVLLITTVLLGGGLGIGGGRDTAAFAAGVDCGPADRLACEPATGHQADAAAQQLADTFSPIVMLKRQRYPCDREGEPYLPAPVEVVFDDPSVVLRRHAGDGPDVTVSTAPDASDLANLDQTYYLDFPGNSRSPGCTYERWARSRMAGHEPVTYGNVVVDGERGKVVVQYWFWYVFNDFNNTHEGDWEMIQVVFDARSVNEALIEQPVMVGYAGHGGGEFSNWDDDKLHKEGTHPVVFAAAGSHASKYGSGTYLAWGEDNSGFGCDVTTGPSDRVAVPVILVTGDVTNPSGPFAWASFAGRWGERQRAFYNGPPGPYGRSRWDDPMRWQDELRSSSLMVSDSTTFGPVPTSVFCGFASYASLALTRVVVYPWIVVGLIAGLIAGVMLLLRIGGGTVRDAWRIYRQHAPVFVGLGLLLLPIGLLANALQFFVADHPPGKQLFDTMYASPGARLAFVLMVGALQELVSLIVVGPAAIEAVNALESGRKPTLRSAFRQVWMRIHDLVPAVLRPAAIIFVLALSVVGIPWAIFYTVRWWFVSQAVLMDGAAPRQAAAISSGLVAGRWWRTAATALLLTLVGTAAAPALGIAFLILASPSLRHVNALSSLVYAILLPLAVIGSTLLYRELKHGPSPSQPAAVPRPAGTIDEPSIAPSPSA